jgi:penicillin-binding protein 1A
MRVALKDIPETSLAAPQGVVKAFINPDTGLLAESTSKAGVWEFFQAKQVPTRFTPSLDDSDQFDEKFTEELF